MAQRKTIVYSNVRQFTEQGHEALKDSNLTEAAKHFSCALEKAELYGDEFLVRACAFNLGSCLVAFGQPSRGLVYLSKAYPPEDETDGLQNQADLEYNIGIAKHAVGDVVNAIVAYEKAADGYKDLHESALQVETLSKLAVCYQSLKKPKEAAETLKQVADLYEKLGEMENRAIALSQLTMLLAELKDMEQCSKCLSSLLEVCHELDNPKLKGKIYHDIGMLYSSEKCYQSASECFEHSYHALEEVTREDKDKTLEAVILLNMGAALNHLALYERAIGFHNSAIKKFGELGDKRSQSQVYCNLAFAYSQTENYDEAKEAFERAIQCCKECEDRVEECLATEGLAAIYFRQNDYDNAIKNYKIALGILTKTEQSHSEHGDRIVNKLAEAVEYQLRANKLQDGEEMEGRPRSRGRKHYGRRRRGKPRYGKYNSLVAKGLEETNDESEESSSSFFDSDDGDTEPSTSEANAPREQQQSRSMRERRAPEEHIQSYPEDNRDGGRDTNRRQYHSERESSHGNGNVHMVQRSEREEKSRIDNAENGKKDSRTCCIQ